MNIQVVESWGRVLRNSHIIRRPSFLDEACAEIARNGAPILAYGQGRSYGDVCLNADGRLVATDFLDRIIEVNWQTGILRAEAGLTLDALLRFLVPRGWFVPVSPGTKFVSLGGAVANDIHGKNHETAGTVGCHVRAIGLARSSGQILELSVKQNPELFTATIGGLGLTGLILWVELQLRRISSSYFDIETLAIADLDAFFRAAEESRGWEYTVAWVDCLAKGKEIGRGLFVRGRHAETGGLVVHRASRWGIPLDAPNSLLNARTIGLFNALYRNRFWALGRKTVHYDRFLFPLDRVDRWNRLYGSRGFFQHQCALPMSTAPATIRKLLELTAEQGEGSFLVVLKLLGARASPGILSFPMLGATLALDFPNRGEATLRLLARLSETVFEAGGRLYPAKDATMSADEFQTGYPDWRKVETHRDPAFMSDFWRRVSKIAT